MSAFLYLPSLAAIGNRPLVKDVHVYTAIAWALALLAVVLFGDRKGLRRTLHDFDGFDLDDRLWLRRYPVKQGRFNAGQKLNAAVTAAFAVLFAAPVPRRYLQTGIAAVDSLTRPA